MPTTSGHDDLRIGEGIAIFLDQQLLDIEALDRNNLQRF
jgi:hypothetical protein